MSRMHYRVMIAIVAMTAVIGGVAVLKSPTNTSAVAVPSSDEICDIDETTHYRSATVVDEPDRLDTHLRIRCAYKTVRIKVYRRVCQTRTIYDSEGIAVGTVKRCRNVWTGKYRERTEYSCRVVRHQH